MAARRSTAGAGDEWFEIFFDLVFAVAIGVLADRVGEAPGAAAYGKAILYLLPIWWVWLGETVYTARFPSGDAVARLLALAQVVAVGLMATDVPFDRTATALFPLAFVAARLALLALYARAARAGADARAVVHVYLVGFGIGAAIWAASAVLPPSLRTPAWLLGLAVDFAAPWVGRPVLQRLPLDHRRVPERVGVFTSLLLYVSLDGIVRGVVGNGWTRWTTPVALLSFVAVVAVWWIYAARVNRTELREVLGSGQPYLYAHFLVVLGVGTMSVGVRLAIGAAAPGHAAARALDVVAAGLLVWILGVVAVRELVVGHVDRYWRVPFVTAAAGVLAMAVLAGGGRPIATLAAMVAVLVGLLVIELRHGQPHGAPPHGKR